MPNVKTRLNVKWQRHLVDMNTEHGVAYYLNMERVKKMTTLSSKRRAKIVEIVHCDEQCFKCPDKIKCEVNYGN